MKKEETVENIEELDTSPEKTEKPQKSKKVLTICICVGVLAVGATLGTILGKLFFGGQAYDYSKIDQNDLYDDQIELMKRYDNDRGLNDLVKYTTNYTEYELANIGFNKIAEHDYHTVIGVGLVNAMGVKQTIRSYGVTDKTKYFFENLSNSKIVHVAKRFYQEDENIVTYTGHDVSTKKATWDENDKVEQTIEEYAEQWGRDMSKPTVYIISSKTVLESNSEIKDNKVYIDLELDSKKSVINYVKQMKMTSDLEEYPVFSKVHFQVVLDEQLNLLETHASESYKVKKGVWASATGNLDEIHTYDTHVAIPDLNTNSPYNE